MKTAAGNSKEGRKPWQKLCKVAQSWHRGDEGAVRVILAGDEEGHSEVPKCLWDGGVGCVIVELVGWR